MSDEPTVPYGYCHCGCGQKTTIVKRGDGRAKKGEPRRFISGHNAMPGGKPFCTEEYRVDEETGCWMWQRAINLEGYGHFRRNGKDYRAHRAYYEKHKGPIPEKHDIDHLCRNRACVNPDHLEAVTRAENIRRGVGAKLTREQVLEIRSCNEPVYLISQRTGIPYGTVWSVLNGKCWMDVLPE